MSTARLSKFIWIHNCGNPQLHDTKQKRKLEEDNKRLLVQTENVRNELDLTKKIIKTDQTDPIASVDKLDALLQQIASIQRVNNLNPISEDIKMGAQDLIAIRDVEEGAGNLTAMRNGLSLRK